jgi:hypothetical protein
MPGNKRIGNLVLVVLCCKSVQRFCHKSLQLFEKKIIVTMFQIRHNSFNFSPTDTQHKVVLKTAAELKSGLQPGIYNSSALIVNDLYSVPRNPCKSMGWFWVPHSSQRADSNTQTVKVSYKWMQKIKCYILR